MVVVMLKASVSKALDALLSEAAAASSVGVAVLLPPQAESPKSKSAPAKSANPKHMANFFFIDPPLMKFIYGNCTLGL